MTVCPSPLLHSLLSLDADRMTITIRNSVSRRYIGIILGWFPGRYSRLKTGIFSWSQYELSHLKNIVLRHIGSIAPRLSRDCPISRQTRTFTHGEISQKISQIFRKSPRTHPQNSHRLSGIRRTTQNPAKCCLCPKLGLCQKLCLCYLPQKFFQKIFSNFFSKIFFQKIFPKILTPRALASKMRSIERCL